jgi:hypothetical protein
VRKDVEEQKVRKEGEEQVRNIDLSKFSARFSLGKFPAPKKFPSGFSLENSLPRPVPPTPPTT